MEEQVRVLIIGSGPAGYTAAIYASRANLKPVLYEGIEPGGQLTTTTDVENFPGHPDSVSGPDLMGLMRRQAERFGADIRTGNVTRADLSSRPFHVVIDGEKEIKAETLIIATGATAKYLGLPSETKFRGQGVSACATCDGFFYRKKDVAVVGGGDTACEEATYLASLCRKVYLIVRKPHLRASKAMQQRVFNTPNIEVLFEHNTAEVLGDDSGVTGALLRRNDGSERKIDIAGFFLAIGHHPNTELFAEQLALDAEGYIKVEPGTSKTSVEGVFAAGDVKDPHYRQAITAAASGCVAALDCERFLLQSGKRRTMKKLLLLLAAACCIASCAEIRTTYIGKAYPTTGTAPELYFDWKDVPSDYETMGSIKATPFGKTLEEAQALIEQIGREKGADAIVFEGVVSETSAPTYTTTEKIEKNDDGSKTRTATTSQSVFTTNQLLATFIKYKTQTN